jgi:hypothetical protein
MAVPRPVCLYLSARHDLAMQMDTRESVIEIMRVQTAGFVGRPPGASWQVPARS